MTRNQKHTDSEARAPILEVNNLKKYFDSDSGVVRAVDGITFDVSQGETLGLVGESGCGKSTAGRTIINLYPATGGQVLYKGKNVHQLRGNERRWFNRQMQMIFQDPQASLNPRMTTIDIIGEALDIHHLASSRKERTERVHELLRVVGLQEEHASRYPHEFSGGQRQRIGIARALAVDPQFIIADEPISALDVSVQAQVVNLLKRLQDERELTFIFIAHDLSMIRHISDRVAVMYLGQLMELADSDVLYDQPLHPYTRSLLSAVPVPDPHKERERERIVLEGDVPDASDPPAGCPFNTRCRHAETVCFEEKPEFRDILPGRQVACHRVEELGFIPDEAVPSR